MRTRRRRTTQASRAGRAPAHEARLCWWCGGGGDGRMGRRGAGGCRRTSGRGNAAARRWTALPLLRRLDCRVTPHTVVARSLRVSTNPSLHTCRRCDRTEVLFLRVELRSGGSLQPIAGILIIPHLGDDNRSSAFSRPPYPCAVQCACGAETSPRRRPQAVRAPRRRGPGSCAGGEDAVRGVGGWCGFGGGGAGRLTGRIRGKGWVAADPGEVTGEAGGAILHRTTVPSATVLSIIGRYTLHLFASPVLGHLARYCRILGVLAQSGGRPLGGVGWRRWQARGRL